MTIRFLFEGTCAYVLATKLLESRTPIPVSELLKMLTDDGFSKRAVFGALDVLHYRVMVWEEMGGYIATAMLRDKFKSLHPDKVDPVPAEALVQPRYTPAFSPLKAANIPSRLGNRDHCNEHLSIKSKFTP